MADSPNSVVEREITEYAAFCMNADLGTETELYRYPNISPSGARLAARSIASAHNITCGHTVYDLDAIEIRKRTVRMTAEYGPWTNVQG